MIYLKQSLTLNYDMFKTNTVPLVMINPEFQKLLFLSIPTVYLFCRLNEN